MSTTTDVPAGPGAGDIARTSIRHELDQTRELFLELTRLAGDRHWNSRSGNPAWTVGQVLGHIVLIFQAIPWKMERLRKGKGAPKPPDFIFNPMNVLSTRLSTRKFRPTNIVAAYDDAHARALATLEGVEPHEWELSATFFGEHQDTAELFRYHARHVREHEPDIRAGVESPR